MIYTSYNEFTYDFQKFLPGTTTFDLGRTNIKDVDLMIFTGGADVSPSLYGEKNFSSYPNPSRDKIEIEIFELCMLNHIKMLGVCRGHQFINAMLGGKLIQNITPSHGNFHNINWTIPGQTHVLRDFYPQEVNSIHHQGYNLMMMTDKLTALALGPEGVVEAATNFDNILTVQFHPEWLNSTSFFSWIGRTWLKGKQC